MKKSIFSNKWRDKVNCVDEVTRKLKFINEIKKVISHYLKIKMIKNKQNEPK